MKISEKVVARMKSELGIEVPSGQYPRRLYHGYKQRALGAWIWVIGENTEWPESYGSGFSMSELLKAKKWEVYNNGFGANEILPA